MENFGICSKVMYKGVAEYNDRAYIVAGDVESISLHMRVYPELRTNFKSVENDPYSWVTNQNTLSRKEIIMTPMSEFRWETQGGSFAWDQPTEIYLNKKKASFNGQESFPIISCPESAEPSVNKYLIEFRNPVTDSLLRPVSQDEELTILCEVPSKIRTILLSKMPSPSDNSLSAYIYKPNK